MTPEQIKRILTGIITTGSAPITPPVFGWLVENGIVTPKGFDISKAKAILEGVQ